MYLDWKTNDTQDYFVIDIETDDLAATKIWCMTWENVKTGEKGDCIGPDESRAFIEGNPTAIFIGHNALSFDVPVLNRLCGTNIPTSRVIDTLVLGTLYSPNIAGGQSLAAWAQRMGEQKGDYNDFSRFTPEMLSYCRLDTAICARLYRKLATTINGIGMSEEACYIQHHITVIIEQQRKNGFRFDAVKATDLYQTLRGLEAGLANQVHAVFPASYEPVANYKHAFKKDGTHTLQYLRHLKQFPDLKIDDLTGGYEAWDYVHFNLGSPDQRNQKLLDLGWKPRPDERTPTGNPQPFAKGKLAASLEAFLDEHDVPEVRLIADWMSYNGRGNMVNTWLENWNEDTGCIHGKLFVADTLRFRHNSPNTANIPAVRKSKTGDVLRGADGHFTFEARDCWVARPNRVLVGTDAAGLELRMLAHYLASPEFTRQLLEGDPHQFNADLAGTTREIAKTLIYAVLYGAQAGKVAAIINGTFEQGKELRQRFLDRLGLSEVMNSAISEQKNGRVWLVDGSAVVCPSPHAALNYRLQGSGARVMQKAAIILDDYIRRAGLDCLKVGDIHDEWQFDVDPRDAAEHARLSVQAIRDAGEELNFNLPLDGEAKEGLTWSRTH